MAARPCVYTNGRAPCTKARGSPIESTGVTAALRTRPRSLWLDEVMIGKAALI